MIIVEGGYYLLPKFILEEGNFKQLQTNFNENNFTTTTFFSRSL